ncbi:hypothetical protein ACLOJK_022991 [Asimina triloba]
MVPNTDLSRSQLRACIVAGGSLVVDQTQLPDSQTRFDSLSAPPDRNACSPKETSYCCRSSSSSASATITIDDSTLRMDANPVRPPSNPSQI